ncbi:4-hydroxy-tetrahydrodipicolinate reductase [Candidatus Trichorickettsia mobilis]|uniref:4-hydroxy-tetrahydrodipicolinate reductase n=1 Tax=Candidatus Trichorickettsia mobilis TaxID=1346319 RepID=A0ABZ0UXM3_9RICK|nr:4-hydroxy-tetrahydrodipicolinate reductase [Candidatus Trichorickettsia mobilis]WPY01372.1 4-hydroxy-tetrahydrodipicolinate reductase [Candidatus Trichorickettsia mobilis]
MIKIGLCGATGRMGLAINQIIDKFADKCVIVAEFSRTQRNIELTDFCNISDVIIDFSSPNLLEELLECSKTYNTKLVIGTTGLEENHLQRLQQAALNKAIIYSANMSIGANVIAKLAMDAARMLDNEYDIEILDIHHRLKRDAPSGTALMYGKLLSAVRGINFDQDNLYTVNRNGVRDSGTIGFASLRGGGYTGEHEIIFAGNDEVITIKHQTLNRKVFAEGAIAAACWIIDKQPGLYSMLDML